MDETSIELTILLSALRSPDYKHMDEELEHLLQHPDVLEGIELCQNEKHMGKQETRKLAYKVAYVLSSIIFKTFRRYTCSVYLA